MNPDADSQDQFANWPTWSDPRVFQCRITPANLKPTAHLTATRTNTFDGYRTKGLASWH